MSYWKSLSTFQKTSLTGLSLSGLYALSELYASYSEMDFTGDLILITGGGSGIGRKLSLALAKTGSRIVIWDVNEEGINDVVDEIKKHGGEAYGYTVDITDREKVYATAQLMEDTIGKVDVLINNAGIVTGKRLLECPDALMEKTMQVNTISHFWTIKAFLPNMLSRNSGQIVTVASMAGIIGSAGLVDYCASKFGAVGIAETLGMELKRLGKSGVSSVCICPFYIKTGMFTGASSRFESLLPILEPDDVVDRIIKAMKRKTPLLMMPWFCTTGPFLKTCMPNCISTAVMDFLGMNHAMDDFVQTRTN